MAAEFGDVLRGLGSVLNPQVAAGLDRESLLQQQQAQQVGMMALQQKMAQAQTERQQAFTAEENKKKLAAQYQMHMDEIKSKAAERMAQIEFQVREGRITREQAAAEAARVRQEAQERDQNFRRELVGLMAANRPPVQPHLVTIEDPNNPGKGILVPAAQAVGARPFKEPTEKAVPSPLQRELTTAAELADATKRFTETFKDNFGGKTITGEAGNIVGRVFGDDTGQTQWWQDYELHQSQVRNKLFGSALTKTEMEAWNKSAINPRMDSGEIRKNLERRADLEKKGLDRLMKGAVAGGYKKEQIEAFTGRGIADTAPTAPPSGKVVDFGSLK